MSGPTVTLTPVTVNEGQAFVLAGTVSPPAQYMIQGSVNWGTSPGSGSESFTVYTNSSGAFSLPHVYYDDGPSPGNGTPSDAATITLSGTIMGQGGSSPVNASTTATVQNVNPVPQLGLINYMPYGGPQWKLSGTIDDAGLSDLHDIAIDWGDGSPPTIIEDWPTRTQFERVHQYPSNDEAGVPRNFLVSVSVVDDDTGAAPWSDDAPMYLLDLDNDADNDWDIDGDDDPIEHLPPGRYVLVNDDDDNANGIADGTEAGPISGEDDLEPFKIKWAPADRPELDYYNGWNLTLVVHGPGVQLWSNPDKTGPQVLQEYPPGWGLNWVIGVDPIPSTLYLEALSATTPGGIQLDLLLTSPQWGPTDGDVVVFTALPLPTVDLDTDSDNNHVLEESDLEDQDEATRPHPIGIPGKIILRNHDDDNGNTIQDRLDPSPFVDGSGNPVMDNELVPIKPKVAANGNDLSDFTVTLIPSGQEIRVWKTQDKQPTALTFSLVTMPAQL
jgi:hypothetical protein